MLPVILSILSDLIVLNCIHSLVRIPHFTSTHSWTLWVTINTCSDCSGGFPSPWNRMFAGQASRIAWKNIIIAFRTNILVEILVCGSTPLNIDNFCMGIDVEPCSSSRSSPKCSLRHLLVIIIAGLLCSISLLSIIIFRLLYRSILYQSHFLTSPKLINIRGTLRINWCYNISIWCAVLSQNEGLSY